MNCVEFRRQLLLDPQVDDVQFRQHASDCMRCAEAQQRALGFESALHSALAVPVPAQLAEAILLRQTTEQQRGCEARHADSGHTQRLLNDQGVQHGGPLGILMDG